VIIIFWTVTLYVVIRVLKGHVISILILKMEVIHFVESLVTTYKTTWHHSNIQIAQLIIPPDTQKTYVRLQLVVIYQGPLFWFFLFWFDTMKRRIRNTS
jgi:hypothetical protein